MRRTVLILFVSILPGALPLDAQSSYTVETIAGGGLPGAISGASANFGGAGAVSSVAINASGVYIALGAQGAVLRLDPSGLLSRVAGIGINGWTGDGGQAVSAQLASPVAITLDSGGNLDIADSQNGVVRRVSGGIITTVAGGGSSFAENVPATSASLGYVEGLAVDAAGSIYIAESARVLKVSNGTISTLAGTGSAAFSGDDGPATAAGPSFWLNIAVDGFGKVYIADIENNRVRMVSNGIITTIAGTGESEENATGALSPDGPALSAKLALSGAIATDAAGNVYISDYGRIRKIANGTITTVAGVGPSGVGWDYAIGDNGPALQAIVGPTCLAADADGNIYLGDGIADSARVRKISNGIITTVAGGSFGSNDGYPAIREMLRGPVGVAANSDGTVYTAEYSAHRIRVVSGDLINTAAGDGQSGPPGAGIGGPPTGAALIAPSQVAVDPSGVLYFSNANNILLRVSGGVVTQPLPTKALDTITGLAADEAGNVYAAQLFENQVMMISKGVATPIAGSGTAGYTGDNGPALIAQLNRPLAVAVDNAGAVYIADSENQVVRKVQNGTITTVGAPLEYLTSVATDAAGNVYEASNTVVQKVSNGVSTIIAGGGASYGDGGPATSAQFLSIDGLAVDSAGIVYVSDSGNNRIRALIPTTDGAGMPTLRVVSAASYEPAAPAPESIATVFGADFATGTATSSGSATLGGASVAIRDAAGIDRVAPLFYASPTQVNLEIPAGTAPGAAQLSLHAAGGDNLVTSIQIAPVWPTLFALNDQGLAAAYVQRVHADQSQSLEPIYAVQNGKLVATPIDLGPTTDKVYLVVYGTGIRAAGAAGVSANVGGTPATVAYAGPSTSLGEDQIDMLLPQSLAGSGAVAVLLTAQGLPANLVNITIK